jgi:uncharacterized repeat protein (TIGR01451 family)
VLALTKAGPAWANPGALITYALRVSNGGAFTATAVVLTDPLPAGGHFVAASDGGNLAGGTASGGAVIWPAFDVAALGALTRTLMVTATGTITNDDYRAAAEGLPTVVGAAAVRTARNHPPEAAAGPDQTVDRGDLVTLDGSGSGDPDGHPLTIRWTQTDGPGVSLSDGGALSPTFTAPGVAGVLTFTLTVSDAHGLSDADATTVTVCGADTFVYLPLVVRQSP